MHAVQLIFLLFLPTVTLLYFLLPHRFRWMLLLAASCLFYMAFIPVYILVLFVTILIDYFAALRIEATQGQSRKLLSADQMVYGVAGIVTLCVFEILQGHRRIGAALRPERILQRWGCMSH